MIMRNRFLGLLAGLALTARAATTHVVQTDDSGAVVKPGNFWSGNQAALLQVLPPLPSSAVQTDDSGAVVTPGNFWQANQAALLQALALPPYVQTDSGGAVVSPYNFWQINRTALLDALALPPYVQTDTGGAVVSPNNFWQVNKPALLQVLALPPYVQTDSGGVIVSPANFWQVNQTALLQALPPYVQTDASGVIVKPSNFWQANKTALLQDLPPYVQTDANGAVVSPANFWQSNKTALVQVIPPAPTNVVQVDTNGTVLGPTNFWQGNLPSLVQVLTPSLPPTPATAIVMRSPSKSWRITIDDNGVLTPTAVLDVIVESRTGGQNFAAYSDVSPGFPNSWANSTSKSTAPGCSAASIGSRYNSNAGIGGATTYFQVAPTLPVMGGTYDLYVTVNSTAGANVVSTITQTGCTGLPATTTAFSVNSANVWTRVGTLTLNLTVTTPSIRFDETANDNRFIADAVKFVYVK